MWIAAFWIRIRILNADPDPHHICKVVMKKILFFCEPCSVFNTVSFITVCFLNIGILILHFRILNLFLPILKIQYEQYRYHNLQTRKRNEQFCFQAIKRTCSRNNETLLFLNASIPSRDERNNFRLKDNPLAARLNQMKG